MTNGNAYIICLGSRSNFLVGAIPRLAILSRFSFSPPPATRYGAYRAFWAGSLASVSGFQMLRFGQFWLIFQLTGSPLALGYVGLANGIPAIFLNLFGGLAADRVDQRRLIVIAQSITAGLIFLLATLTLLELVKVWHLLTIAFLAGAVEAFDQPARRTLFPHLIDRKVMMSAVALNSAIWPGTRILAPAIAGFIIAWFGTAAAFYVAGSGFLVMAAITYGLRLHNVTSAPSRGAVHDLREGLHFIRQNTIFSFFIALTFFSSFFGMAYIPLMPVIAVDILQVGAKGQGLLLGVGGVGSLATSVWLATRSSAGSKGLLILGGSLMAGLSVATFALTSWLIGSFALALALMFIIGVFTSMSNTSLQSSMQMAVPDALRGRVMGFYGMTYNIRPLGGMQAGALASLITTPLAIAVGGLAVASFALAAPLISRRIRHLDATIPGARTSEADEGSQPTPFAATGE